MAEGLTILSEALTGKQKPRSEYVSQFNAVDEQGNYYYEPPSNNDYSDIEIDPGKATTNVNESNVAIDVSGTVRDTKSPTSQGFVKQEARKSPESNYLDTLESREGTYREQTAEERQADALEGMNKSYKDEKKAERVLAGAKFFISVMNAESAYSSYEASSILNIQNQRAKANDALQRGRQRSLDARQEGRRISDDVLLRMAAQGQDVSGMSVQNLQKSYEAVAAQNALQEETNAIREALGYQLEEVAIGYELDQRAIQRDNTIISAGLKYGAEYYKYS